MQLTEIRSLASSGDFEGALAACVEAEGDLEEQLEVQCVKAWCLSRLGEQAAALQESIAVLEKAAMLLGPTHHVTLEALNDAGRFSARCSDLQAAVIYGNEAWVRRAETLGSTHPKTLTSLANLLRYRSALGEAIPDEELEALKSGWQTADPNVVDQAHLNAWALLVELTGDGPGVAACLARFEEVLGADHPDTRRAYEQLKSSGSSASM